ncbi:MAG: hypothetical protein K0Q87_3945, partial [Neobacillus sp.]|nr:hypothetical protein [Neobacillus sp.]
MKKDTEYSPAIQYSKWGIEQTMEGRKRMRNLYYEDIEEKDLAYGQNLLDWYVDTADKESGYFRGQKEQFTVNQDKEKYECDFYLEGRKYFCDEDTTEQIEKQLSSLRFQFVHKEDENWTPDHKKERELLFAETIFVKASFIDQFRRRDRDGYLFYCFEPRIHPLKKCIVKDRAYINYFMERDSRSVSFEFQPIRCRSLFYEDIETISVKELEEWQVFYEKWLQKQNAYFMDKKEYYPGMEKPFAIKYHKREIQAATQSEWEAELEKVGYLFSHKLENGWTEQPQAKLFRVIDEGTNTSGYLFLGVREDII